MKLLFEPTIIRSILKIGGGYLVAKGITDDVTANELAGAVAALVAIIWGIISANEKKKLQAQSGSPTTTPPAALLCLAGALLFLPACQTASNRPGRVLASAVVTVDAAMQGWWTYEALGQAKPDEIAKVREAYASYQAVEAVAEKAYVTSAKLNDQTAWRQASEALKATQADLLKLIDQFQRKTIQ